MVPAPEIDWHPYPDRLPTTLFGVRLQQHPNLAEVALWRKRAATVTAAEGFVALCSLPLGVARGGVGVISGVANSFLLILSMIGLSGSIYINPIAVMIHASIVCSLSVVLVAFLIFSLSEDEDHSDGADIIAYIFLVLCSIDIVAGCITARFTSELSKCERFALEQRRNSGGGGGGGSGGGGAHRYNQLVPIDSASQSAPSHPPPPAHPFSTAPRPSATAASQHTPAVQRTDSWHLTPEEDETVPQFFRCPITGEVMVDPVQCSDGHTYERYAIAAWLKHKSTSPNTNLPLKNKKLLPNHALRQAIETHVEQVRENGVP